MKNYEVGIIVAVIIVAGYIWLVVKPSGTANPTNATSPGYKSGTP